MSDIEKEIEDLEHILELKKAYVSVDFSFPESSDFSEKVKKEVINELQKSAKMLATGKSTSIEQKEELPIKSPFSDLEIEVLKSFIKQILGKVNVPTTKKEQEVQPQQNALGKIVHNTLNKPSIQSIGTIIYSENISRDMRSKVDPESKVKVLELRDENAFVTDQKGNRFWIPLEDIEF